MITMVIVALIVLFGAALAGKMLMEMFPNAGFGMKPGDEPEPRSPAE